MVIKKAELETVCGVTSKLPQHDRMEAAFAGKSNVGKSSLLNALMNRKSLARTSSKPGKTQTINYYNINDAFYLVDLPGYGYTEANVAAKTEWGKMTDRYLCTSEMLYAIFLLVDIRHAPGENDRQMYEWITAQGYHPIVIATKMDKLKRSQIEKQLKMIRTEFQMGEKEILIPFSAETKQGREEIYGLLDNMLVRFGENKIEN